MLLAIFESGKPSESNGFVTAPANGHLIHLGRIQGYVEIFCNLRHGKSRCIVSILKDLGLVANQGNCQHACIESAL